MTEADFRDFFRHTPFWRAKRRGLLRNAAIVAANIKDLQCIPILLRLLADNEEIVRAAAVWALSQMANSEIYEHLERLKEVELSPVVLEELRRIDNLR
jgi:epoxyqueuosine reductase